MAKAVISLSTGLEDAEKVTVAFLVAVGAAETLATTSDEPARRDMRRVALLSRDIWFPPEFFLFALFISPPLRTTCGWTCR